MKFKRIAIDTSKHVFTLHGVDAQERPVLRRNLKRAEMEASLRKLAPTEVVLEACGGAHHWGRAAEPTGSSRAPDPAAIRQALRQARRRTTATMPRRSAKPPRGPPCASVAVKTAEQQADSMILRHREMLVAQRTPGDQRLARPCRRVRRRWPPRARSQVEAAAAQAGRRGSRAGGRQGDVRPDGRAHRQRWTQQIEALESELLALHKANPVSQLLAEVPGIGPITAITLALDGRARTRSPPGGTSPPGSA